MNIFNLVQQAQGACRGCGVRRDDLLVCPCRLASYCSFDCQTRHWPQHRSRCSFVRRGHPKPRACHQCGTLSTHHASCSCGEAVYCDANCQVAHWGVHRAVCTAVDGMRTNDLRAKGGGGRMLLRLEKDTQTDPVNLATAFTLWQQGKQLAAAATMGPEVLLMESAHGPRRSTLVFDTADESTINNNNNHHHHHFSRSNLNNNNNNTSTAWTSTTGAGGAANNNENPLLSDLKGLTASTTTPVGNTLAGTMIMARSPHHHPQQQQSGFGGGIDGVRAPMTPTATNHEEMALMVNSVIAPLSVAAVTASGSVSGFGGAGGGDNTPSGAFHGGAASPSFARSGSRTGGGLLMNGRHGVGNTVLSSLLQTASMRVQQTAAGARRVTGNSSALLLHGPGSGAAAAGGGGGSSGILMNPQNNASGHNLLAAHYRHPSIVLTPTASGQDPMEEGGGSGVRTPTLSNNNNTMYGSSTVDVPGMLMTVHSTGSFLFQSSPSSHRFGGGGPQLMGIASPTNALNGAGGLQSRSAALEIEFQLEALKATEETIRGEIAIERREALEPLGRQWAKVRFIAASRKLGAEEQHARLLLLQKYHLWFVTNVPKWKTAH